MISRRAVLAGASAALTWQAAPGHATLTLEEVVGDPALQVMGNRNGGVTIVEFFNYFCPTCKAIHPHLKEIVRADGNIRLVMKDWPFNGDVDWYASRMAHASASLGYYHAAHNALMAIEGPPTYRQVDDALRRIGADPVMLRYMLEAKLNAIDAMIARNKAHAGAFSLAGTPGFLIGNRLYKRPLAPNEIIAAITLARKAQ